jgi:hypothetical protein
MMFGFTRPEGEPSALAGASLAGFVLVAWLLFWGVL